MFSDLFSALKVLAPPDPDDREGQARWRWVVFAAMVVLGTSLTMHIAIACGYLPAISSGFALKSDQTNIQRRIDVIATLSIEHEIRGKTGELCREKDMGRRWYLNDDVGKLQKEYKDILGYWYPTPGCDKL